MTCPAAHIPHDCRNRLACLRAQTASLANADRLVAELSDRRPLPLVWPSDPEWKGAAA